MNNLIKRKRLVSGYLALLLTSIVVVFLPHAEAFAAYRVVANHSYKASYTTASFKYINGGLGIRASCLNSKGKNQTMYLQRKMNGQWVTRGMRTVYCNKGVEAKLMKYNYYYIPNTVSGQYYRLKFVNSDPKTTTSIYSEVNPN
jgi:hypothetical protein